MFSIVRCATAAALSGLLLLAGCAGDSSLLSKQWNGKPTKKAKAANKPPKMGPTEDTIPSAASVGLAVPTKK